MFIRMSVLALALLSIGCGSDSTSPADGGRDLYPMLDAGPPRDGEISSRTEGGVRDGGPPPAIGPRFIGRVDTTDPSRVRMQWSGTGMVLRFRGTRVRATLTSEASFFTVLVDGELVPRLEVSGEPRSYTLAENLVDGEHVLELYRRTEAFFGITILSNIEVDGEILSAPPRGRVIEVVGDSITCGYGNEGQSAECRFSADTENHFSTYAALAAREVGAELSTVAWSGKGVVYNYDEDRTQPMPELYPRTLPSEASSTGRFEPAADAVIVNLGTNDFSTGNDPSELEFTNAYIDLLTQIRARHPEAVIFCTLAPLLAAPDYDLAASYIESAIAQRADEGDSDVFFIDLRVPTTAFGCDYHPNLETHEAMADLLVDVLAADLGW